MKNKLTFWTLLLLLPAILVIILWQVEKRQQEPQVRISNFQECLEAGYSIMESHPRQCRAGDQTFVEDLDQE